MQDVADTRFRSQYQFFEAFTFISLKSPLNNYLFDKIPALFRSVINFVTASREKGRLLSDISPSLLLNIYIAQKQKHVTISVRMFNICEQKCS